MRSRMAGLSLLTALGLGLAVVPAHAFCGFYVAAATGELYNDASQVIIAKNGDRTTLSMLNNYRGDPAEFALVVPVPPGIKKQDVKTIKAELFAHLDQWSAPRLVEYWEQDPCYVEPEYGIDDADTMGAMEKPSDRAAARKLGVKIEAQFTAGEYDIVVLSATQSTGLETWLKQNGYKIPAGAAPILKPYIDAKTNFFVAKVNLKRLAAQQGGPRTQGGLYLSPLQFGFKSVGDKVGLPIKLGMINGKGTQDLIIFMISMKGRFEVTNYDNPKIPTDIDVPESMKDKGKFGKFFLKMFERELGKHKGQAVFTEYAWPSGWCDPCSADPISAAQLGELGMGKMDQNYQPAFITRLHARYSKETFTKDLEFKETTDQTTFQGRYIIRHPWKGKVKCKNPVRGRWGDQNGNGGGGWGGPVMPRG